MIINEQTRLSQIENLLSYLITLIQQQQDIQKKAGIVTQKELLSILKISPNTLRSWEKIGLKRLEPPIEGTRTVYYKMDDVINYLTL
ncbi:MerR family transcriptional regulator [uncultured Streptococcus sp.]|uniref:MerR family transcriptional regulator n=1 Tax=uncultured Streptococcus sp. TaxID=83427 RepID=UPI000F1D60A2|nr:MerR family transcriptional regulator [uncultured Streptococcus sp.]RKV65387.1 MAG: MerR family transcriptional regulator [Streptococcus sp.]